MYRVDFNRLRVLVVDDNVHMRRIIKTLLAGFGTRDIFEAEEGGKGVELFTTHSPDIVITDWMMPGVDGVEFTRLLRQAPSSVNTRMRSHRFNPVARASPSSRLRSSANMTNRFTSSSTPASTLNVPTPV